MMRRLLRAIRAEFIGLTYMLLCWLDGNEEDGR